jgi:hypothetical protein
MQAYKNHRDGCDIFNIDNYDWWDVGASAVVGALAPGMMAVGKTAWKSGNAIKALSSQSANTANRAAKIAGRIAEHKNGIKDVVATQVTYQGIKAAAKAANGGASSCGCER